MCFVSQKKTSQGRRFLTSLKRKKQIYESVDFNSSTMKRQRFRRSLYKNRDAACYKWLVNAGGQSLPISVTVLKTKALFFAKELGCNDFRASDGWFERWEKRKNVSFKSILDIFIYVFSNLDSRSLQILTVL